jgi:tight adherence protein C
MDLAIALLFFAAMSTVLAVWGYDRYVKPARIRQRLGEAALDQPSADLTGPSDPKTLLVRVIHQIGEKAPVSPQDVKMTRRRLIAAGHRTENSVRIYYGCKLLACAVGFLLSLFVRGYINNPIGSVVVIPVLAGLGFFLPNLVLDKLVDRRREAIRLALPDALDLLVVAMEAGLGLDQAIACVARELRMAHPALCEELSLVTLEMRHGTRRMEALKNLAARSGEGELRKLIATMIQADRFGTSVGDSLRTHSDYMRVRRRQAAEERAGKVGVKLVFPIFFFILPAMMVVAAGPGVLQLIKHLFPMMTGSGR